MKKNSLYLLLITLSVTLIVSIIYSNRSDNRLKRDEIFQEKNKKRLSNNISSQLPKQSNIFKNSGEDEKVVNGSYNSLYGPLPGSLEGTKIDGGLEVDFDGGLLISKDIRKLFEYFLSASGEEDFDIIKGRIIEYINLSLPEKTALEAIAILESYLLYKNKLYDLEKSGLNGRESGFNLKNNQDIKKLKNTLAQKTELRRMYMREDVAEEFFNDEEQYDNFTLDRIEIQNREISDIEKENLYKDLLEKYPVSVTDNFQNQKDEINFKNKIEQLRNTYGNEEKIFQLRKDAYGEEAAVRLSENDKNQTSWKNRISDYKNEIESIKSNNSLSGEEKITLTENLEDSFTQKELLRIKAILSLK
ncbi:MAG: hypothetical protein GY760_22000 [Deltaproteobacteria bacterium]|nr:hypothetical protein [Deltaproteobacteria bacterium]